MFTNFYLRKNLSEFLKIYNNRPIKNNDSGMKIDHCYGIYCLLKKIKPKYVIESGVWKGQTTWLIKQALKKAIIYSIDLDLTNRSIIYKDVKYLKKDISEFNWKKLNKDKTLIIFDDHVCFSKRLKFLRDNNFRHIIFDDNVPNGFLWYYTPKMIVENQILIKREFIKYSNFSRVIKFLYKFLFRTKYKNCIINFNLKFMKITFPPFINKTLKKDFNLFKNNLIKYYEFPPIIRFNFKKRFKKVIENFDTELKEKNYIVKKPITNLKKLKLEKNLINELNAQYSNLCYIKLKNK